MSPLGLAPSFANLKSVLLDLLIFILYSLSQSHGLQTIQTLEMTVRNNRPKSKTMSWCWNVHATELFLFQNDLYITLNFKFSRAGNVFV